MGREDGDHICEESDGSGISTSSLCLIQTDVLSQSLVVYSLYQDLLLLLVNYSFLHVAQPSVRRPECMTWTGRKKMEEFG